MSSCWQIRGTVDRIALFQCHASTIRRDIFKTRINLEQAIQMSLRDFSWDFSFIPRLQEEQKICLWSVAKKKKKHSKYRAFLILFCDKLRSHLRSDWLINRRSKDTALYSGSYRKREKTQSSVYVCKECLLRKTKPCAPRTRKPQLYGDISVSSSLLHGFLGLRSHSRRLSVA